MSLDAWRAESLRLTAFTLDPMVGEQRWWEDLVKEQPEVKVVKPKEGEERVSGPYNNAELSLSVVPGRIDWLLSPSKAAQESAAGVADIGSFREALETFMGGMQQWLASAPSIARLAFGAVLLQPVDDRVAGYRVMQRYMSALRLDADNSSDFVYQINRPRPTKTGINGAINRLSKWSVISAKKFGLQLALEGQQPVFATSPIFTACRAELDINTSPAIEKIAQEQLIPVFFELTDLASEIATKGDVP